MNKYTPPKQMALKIVKLLKKESPDPNYLRKLFEYIRIELKLKGKTKKSKKLPELLTEEEIKRFYSCVWNSSNRTHMVMIKLLLYTGIRNSELANIKISDVDLASLKVRINLGKGEKDRYVLLPEAFKGELTQYILTEQEKGSHYLFETNRKTKPSTRWIREIIKRYAIEASIEKRIYPHLFRHQLFTFLTKKGLIDAKIQLISGHSNKQSLSIYQDLSLKDIETEYQNAMKDFPVL